MLYQVVESTLFVRSFKTVSQYRNFDRAELERVVGLLRSDARLEHRHRDHELKGKHAGIRECHVKNDLLLLYQKRKDILVLLLVNIGTHNSVLGK